MSISTRMTRPWRWRAIIEPAVENYRYWRFPLLIRAGAESRSMLRLCVDAGFDVDAKVIAEMRGQ